MRVHRPRIALPDAWRSLRRMLFLLHKGVIRVHQYGLPLTAIYDHGTVFGIRDVTTSVRGPVTERGKLTDCPERWILSKLSMQIMISAVDQMGSGCRRELFCGLLGNVS